MRRPQKGIEIKGKNCLSMQKEGGKKKVFFFFLPGILTPSTGTTPSFSKPVNTAAVY